MKIFKKYIIGLSVAALIVFGVRAVKFEELVQLGKDQIIPVQIQNYINMLSQIIKEQKDIRDLVDERKYGLAREISGVGGKVGQDNYWLRQNIKENLKDLRAVHPKLVKILNGFFDIIDSFYDVEADLLGAVTILNRADLETFNNVVNRLAQDKTVSELKALIGVKAFSFIIPPTLIPKLEETQDRALFTGKMLFDHFQKLLQEKE